MLAKNFSYAALVLYICMYSIGQSRDKILYILPAFVFYPVMMVASKLTIR